MKLLQGFVLRLFSLSALAGGGIIAGLALPVEPVAEAHAQALAWLPEDWRVPGLALGCVLAVFGAFGLLPLGPGLGRKITFAGEYGPITARIAPIERRLRKLLLRLPEIDKIKLRILPDKDGEHARIVARAWLRKVPGQCARDIEHRVAGYIEDAATDYLGLEARTPVELVIEDIAVDAAEAEEALQDHARSRADSASAPAAVASAGATAVAALAAETEARAPEEWAGNEADEAGEEDAVRMKPLFDNEDDGEDEEGEDAAEEGGAASAYAPSAVADAAPGPALSADAQYGAWDETPAEPIPGAAETGEEDSAYRDEVVGTIPALESVEDVSSDDALPPLADLQAAMESDGDSDSGEATPYAYGYSPAEGGSDPDDALPPLGAPLADAPAPHPAAEDSEEALNAETPLNYGESTKDEDAQEAAAEDSGEDGKDKTDENRWRF